MKALSLLKLWRKYGGRWNEGDGVNEDSSDLALNSAGPQLDFDKFVMKNNSSILINTTVGITSFDNDTNRHSVHTNLSKRVDAQAKAKAKAKPTAFNIFSIQTSNLESQSPLLILQSSPKFCVSMLGSKKSDQKTEFHCMTTPKKKTTTEDSKRFDTMKFSVQEVENSSSSKYLKLIKPLYVKASKIKIFANGEKQAADGNRPAVVFREVCKNLMKSKSSVRTVPVAVQRRDDSAVQQQDGIQSAILHCKRSYSSSSSSTISQECTALSRSASESSNQKATINPQVIGV